MNGAWEITKLAELLDTSKNANQKTELKQKVYGNQLPSEKPTIVTEKEVEEEKKVKDELEEEQTEIADWRKCPMWDLIYKQQVTPSDVFLQMSGKTTLTSSCEEMVITVNMPEENSKNFDLNLTKNHLNLLSQCYRLSVPLPHPIDPQKGDAKWDPDTRTLKITLVMDREFDYINF